MSEQEDEQKAHLESGTQDQAGKQRGPSGAAPKRQKRSKTAAEGRGAPAKALTTPTATATEARIPEIVELPNLPTFSESEHEVLKLLNIDRRTPHEVVKMLNTMQNTQAWNLDKLGEVIKAVNVKLLRAGEINAARPNAHVVEETRRRYDSLIERLEADLLLLPETHMFLSERRKQFKTIADIQRMRDDALQAIAPLPGTLPSGGALVYVSRLRAPAPGS